jgi:hypothetical protein
VQGVSPLDPVGLQRDANREYCTMIRMPRRWYTLAQTT